MLQNLGEIRGILILNHNQVLIHLQEVEMLQYVGWGDRVTIRGRQTPLGQKTALEILVPILKGK